jgi:hypothetical protein
MQVVSHPDERRAFWPAFVDWHSYATDAEIEQLERSITCIQTSAAEPISTVLKHALDDVQLKQQLPASLVDRFAKARWPSLAAVN